MTVCICGHLERDHFDGGRCPCGCLIFDPDTTAVQRPLVGAPVTWQMELPERESADKSEPWWTR